MHHGDHFFALNVYLSSHLVSETMTKGTDWGEIKYFYNTVLVTVF